ncbi:hypothetical protein GCM10012279_08310 [Micromonospora yangpuensis]|nr:hypothetical protein GCM10012279_08310 [Micromonospora yangpuensis]
MPRACRLVRGGQVVGIGGRAVGPVPFRVGRGGPRVVRTRQTTDLPWYDDGPLVAGRSTAHVTRR